MKKIIIVMIGMIFLIGLASCSSDKEEVDESQLNAEKYIKEIFVDIEFSKNNYETTGIWYGNEQYLIIYKNYATIIDESNNDKVLYLFSHFGGEITATALSGNDNLIFEYLVKNNILKLIDENGNVLEYSKVENIETSELMETSKIIDSTKLQQRDDGLFYEINQLKPFDGTVMSYYENGQIEREKNYIAGRLQGKDIIYYENGEIEVERNYIVGELDGKSIIYYKNGKIKREENYKASELNGKSIVYYENGHIKREENYKASELDGKSIGYYENGQIEMVENYKDGIEDGKYITYYESGQIKYEWAYKAGLEDGQSIGYYENGQILREDNYKDGKLDGKYIIYSSGGRIIVEEYYKDGVKVE
ncbi:MAG: toxin-antitoxin system YwqK family antitoxin [Clostridiales bacterium]|nr:toxin-antitoxin system YwqK family antitoxin [Clostridiales bacterium]